MSSKREKACKFCTLAAKRENALKVMAITIDGVTREVVVWSDHVHASCQPEMVAIAKAEIANRPS